MNPEKLNIRITNQTQNRLSDCHDALLRRIRIKMKKIVYSCVRLKYFKVFFLTVGKIKTTHQTQIKKASAYTSQILLEILASAKVLLILFSPISLLVFLPALCNVAVYLEQVASQSAVGRI